MTNKIYARKAVISESLDARHFAAQERVDMNTLLVDRLEHKSRKLDDVIEIKLARLKFVSIFRAADDQTKKEMFQILLIHGRDWRRGMAKVKAFLKKNGITQS
jgi:hypothetical protein